MMKIENAGSLSPTLRSKQLMELMCGLCSPIGISFKTYPYHVLYDTLMHPAFLLDGRIFLNHTMLEDIGFKVHAIGREGKGMALVTGYW